ncbi:repressor [Candidatus Endoriftia persephone str. Guaymas]|jgi:SOS-response transcriptional repressor LexA|uniref:S24 family peptidase n=6 Tax=Gammaproteobacteria TaxID=1236 RepID=A0A9J7A044_9GAMM|nr:S24 family peptidase [Candidatus Endoriftia persephone]EGW53646.1 putative prophage repressor [endosymbiont of Tevnia jerichonana (vent Tica)]KRT53641.1 Peptidase S24-like [endosymbiont of Ridgeia piscesae]MBA1332425.1 repressor [Candidatus Endoriftia persephone str. Guaymas]USF88354.1 S24 family peptidase [Candidatus Endoriftia persephone]
MSNECSYNELYPLQVLDDSMEPEFPEKCIIVIEPAEVCATGAYIIAEVDGERWFRQYISEGEGKKRLVALKPGYPEIDLQGSEFKILGVIVQRNLRRKIKHYSPYVPDNGTPQPSSLN